MRQLPALAQQTALTPIQPGVYDVRHFTGDVCLVVVHELPQHENNALLHLFIARADLLRYGQAYYWQQSEETSNLLLQLFRRCRLEAATVPDALEIFTAKCIEELLKAESDRP